MKKVKAGKKLRKQYHEEENSVKPAGRRKANFIDKYDWDFIFDREWSRAKK